MTTDVRIARRNVSLLELARDLGNVSKACKLVGYSRQQFYEIRRNYQTYGAVGLVDKVKGPKGPHPNRVAPEIEAAVLDHALAHPTHGPMWVAHELALRGLRVNRERPHQGRGMNGRTPLQAFSDGLPVRPQPQPGNEPHPIAA